MKEVGSGGCGWRTAVNFCSLLLCCNEYYSINSPYRRLSIVEVAAGCFGSSGTGHCTSGVSSKRDLHSLRLGFRKDQTGRDRSAASLLMCCLNMVGYSSHLSPYALSMNCCSLRSH